MTVLDKFWIATLILLIIASLLWGALFAMAQVTLTATVPENPCNKCLKICNQLK